MSSSILQSLGLTGHEANAYELLVKDGASSPPKICSRLGISRTNAYKILDQLVEAGLASRIDINNKLHYRAEDPITLMSLVAKRRNDVLEMEHALKKSLRQLRADFQKTNSKTEIQTYHGEETVRMLYEHQSKIAEPIYFIKSRADIPTLGFETMDRIRRLPAKLNIPRFGITPDSTEANASSRIDKEGNLERTWIDELDYTSPVEWTASGNELMIVSFSENPSVIRIRNPIVTESFRQLWHALDKNLRANPEYKKMPRKAKRKI